MGISGLAVVCSPVQEALAHQLGGHVGDCALGGGLCGVMMHPAHAKVSHLHINEQNGIHSLIHSLTRHSLACPLTSNSFTLNACSLRCMHPGSQIVSHPLLLSITQTVQECFWAR